MVNGWRRIWAGCALALCATVCGDTVEMKDTHLKLDGKVHREMPDYIIFQLKTKDDSDEAEQVRIPRSQIKSIEYDIKTQLDKIEKDDLAGQYKVAEWAMERAMYKDAIKLLEEIKKASTEGKPGAGPDLLKLLGKAYKEREQFDKALDCYADYLRGHPGDADTAAIIKELKSKVNPEVVAQKKKHPQGLEADGTWVAETWQEANPGQAQIIADADGNKMVAFQTPGGQQPKSAFSRSGQPLNLADSKAITFRVCNDSKTRIDLAVAFINSQGEFHETKAKTAQPGTWTQMEIDVTGPVFKCQRNEFKAYDQELAGRERINRITFLVYGTKEARLYIDSLFFK